MNSKLKNYFRDLMPERYQVPVKFYYNRIQSRLEPELDILRYLVSENDLTVDVGGNRGIYAYKLWQLGAKVEVFEPNPECSRVLEVWAESKPRVNIHSAALSRQVGSAVLHIPIDGAGVEHSASASIEDTGFSYVRDQEVALNTLDNYEFENVSFIKIDVEGHELSVIEGAYQTLTSSKPALLVEIEQRHINRPIHGIFEKITSFGFQGFWGGMSGLAPLDKFDVDKHQSMQNFESEQGAYINNFLFLHSDKLDAGKYENLFSGYKAR